MLIRNLSKGKKQKVFEKEDDGKRSGKKLESVKKGKGKEKVEEGLKLKVDSEKKRTRTRSRRAPGNLINLLHNLTKSQRKVVEETGFGKTLLLKLHIIPTSLGYWLLQNYDPSTGILNDGANEYKLTTSLINEIFGIPNGETQEWRGQFDDEMQKKQKKIYVSDLVGYLKKTYDSGRMFKLNFMVVLMSIIGETMKSNTPQKGLKKLKIKRKKSESVNKNDPSSFRLLSQDSNEGNPKIEIGNTENVEKETVGEKEIVEEMVGGTEKIGEELVVEKNVGKEMVVEKIVGEDEINEDTMEAEGDKMGEEKTPAKHRDTFNKGAEERNNEFKKNMIEFFKKEKLDNIKEFDLKEAFVSFIADFAHPKTDEMDDTVVKRFEMPWRTTVNSKDCGIFMMSHMETYMGEKEKAW
ncbi:hypothetical protein L1987_64321 [Smallanthus sonchifolius]|uniref:Uncharacterized protein n=1 Tax=Smallanthus sonchifolius TaxID=185202 RepID=A0ACB9CFN4_9ASTR|nr:hypothetical protein L1987_64321 [Smallanthus sonchifolius]